jgi:hypothetical protein
MATVHRILDSAVRTACAVLCRGGTPALASHFFFLCAQAELETLKRRASDDARRADVRVAELQAANTLLASEVESLKATREANARSSGELAHLRSENARLAAEKTALERRCEEEAQRAQDAGRKLAASQVLAARIEALTQEAISSGIMGSPAGP